MNSQEVFENSTKQFKAPFILKILIAVIFYRGILKITCLLRKFSNLGSFERLCLAAYETITVVEQLRIAVGHAQISNQKENDHFQQFSLH